MECLYSQFFVMPVSEGVHGIVHLIYYFIHISKSSNLGNKQ